MKFSSQLLIMVLTIIGWELPGLFLEQENKLIFPNAQRQVFQDLSSLYKEIPFENVKDQGGFDRNLRRLEMFLVENSKL